MLNERKRIKFVNAIACIGQSCNTCIMNRITKEKGYSYSLCHIRRLHPEHNEDFRIVERYLIEKYGKEKYGAMVSESFKKESMDYIMADEKIYI